MSDTPMPGVTIGLGEIYALVIGLGVKVDVLLAQHSDNVKDLADHEIRLRSLGDAAKDLADHESRLRMLERGRWPLPTLTALVAIAALILSFIKISS